MNKKKFIYLLMSFSFLLTLINFINVNEANSQSFYLGAYLGKDFIMADVSVESYQVGGNAIIDIPFSREAGMGVGVAIGTTSIADVYSVIDIYGQAYIRYNISPVFFVGAVGEYGLQNYLYDLMEMGTTYLIAGRVGLNFGGLMLGMDIGYKQHDFKFDGADNLIISIPFRLFVLLGL